MRNHEIQFHQALKHEHGVDGERNLHAAAERYRDAANAGHTPSMILLGVMLSNVENFETSFEQAEALFLKAAEGGNPRGYYHLGYNDYQREDYPAAMKRFQMAADLGEVRAMVYLGIGNELGHGIPRNSQFAFDWYLTAALLGDRDAPIKLGQFLRANSEFHGFAPTVYALLDSGAQGGDARAYFEMGLLYSCGVLQVKTPEVDAYNCIRKASDLNLLEAQAWCGDALVKGYGCEKDIGQGVELLVFAIEKGSLDAKFAMAHLLMHGTGMKVDHVRAFQLTQEVAESGDEGAQRGLAFMYQNGVGTEPNADACQYWLDRAQGEKGSGTSY